MTRMQTVLSSILLVVLLVPLEVFGQPKLQSPLKDIGGINQLIAAILDVVVLVGTPIAVLFIMYAGFLYITARGDTEKVKNASRALTAAVIGTAILIGAAVIADVIGGTIDELRR